MSFYGIKVNNVVNIYHFDFIKVKNPGIFPSASYTLFMRVRVIAYPRQFIHTEMSLSSYDNICEYVGREKGSTKKPNKVQHNTLTPPMTCLNPVFIKKKVPLKRLCYGF